MKPRDERPLSVDQIIETLRPKFATVPGVMTFMQNPPPITVSGQFGAAAYSLVLQSTDLAELYAWAPKLLGEGPQATPGVCGRQQRTSRFPAPQVMVDIDRDRAQALGINPQQVQDALFQRLRNAAGIGDLRGGGPVRFGDPGSRSEIPELRRTPFPRCTYVPAAGRWFRWMHWCA